MKMRPPGKRTRTQWKYLDALNEPRTNAIVFSSCFCGNRSSVGVAHASSLNEEEVVHKLFSVYNILSMIISSYSTIKYNC